MLTFTLLLAPPYKICGAVSHSQMYLPTFANDTEKENILACLRKQSKIDAYFFKPEFTGPGKHFNSLFARKYFLNSGLNIIY
jgi:hypothetical protein